MTWRLQSRLQCRVRAIIGRTNPPLSMGVNLEAGQSALACGDDEAITKLDLARYFEA